MAQPPTALRDILRTELARLKAAGLTAVSIDDLERFLASASGTDEQHRDLEWSKTIATLEHAGALEMFRSALEAGQTALKTLITINGGAAAALLAFLSNVASKHAGWPQQPQIARAMAIFGAGLFLGGASAVVRYFAQYSGNRVVEARVRKEQQLIIRWTKRGDRAVVGAIVLGLGSLLSVLVGLGATYWALH